MALVHTKDKHASWVFFLTLPVIFILVYVVLQQTNLLSFASRSQAERYERAMQFCQSRGGTAQACARLIARQFPNMAPGDDGRGPCPADGHYPDGTTCGGPTGASGASGTGGGSGDNRERGSCGSRCVGLPSAFAVGCASVCMRINQGQSCTEACQAVPSQYRSMCTSQLCVEQ